MSPATLFHWSPTDRRSGILRRGLCPGSLSLAREWRPPYVALADEPWIAWLLSGRIHPEIPDWDLWMVYAADLIGWEVIFDTFRDTGRPYVKERRVYHRVPKSAVHWIGTRNEDHRPRRTRT